ncbi:MAG: universal stress protein [Oligoflexia bacterium]|nr:universal stress protein [Oligoflexia bacterium]
MLLWAIDPLSDNTKSQHESAERARALGAALNCEVRPVYVYGRLTGIGPSGTAWLEGVAASRGIVQERVSRFLKRVGAKGFSKPAGLFLDSNSTQLRAQELADYAQRSRAWAILCETHARHGLDRFFLGSFTEALMVRSRVPVLSVNPGVARLRLERILFATDFGPYSQQALRRVLELCRRLGAELVLMHAIPRISSLTALSELATVPQGMLPTRALPVSAIREESERKLQVLAGRAEKQGIPTQTVLCLDSEHIPEAILHEAKARKVGLIALETESGRLASALMGSVSRQVVRLSPVPVWTLRSRLAFARRARPSVRKSPLARAA